MLQALLECVRLRTFGKFGLQQMQVDSHYLQVYLWKFVSDEQLVRVLLEQVMASTIERCVDPVLMEQSVSMHYFIVYLLAWLQIYHNNAGSEFLVIHIFMLI